MDGFDQYKGILERDENIKNSISLAKAAKPKKLSKEQEENIERLVERESKRHKDNYELYLSRRGVKEKRESTDIHHHADESKNDFLEEGKYENK